MSIFGDGTYRDYKGYIKWKLSDAPMESLSSGGSPVDEMWSMLGRYSDVPENCHVLLKQHFPNTKQRERAVSSFQSYVTQAKTYYQSGKKVDSITSSLLYYYSFLNLAKAYLLTRGVHVFSDIKFGHGLTSVHTQDSLRFHHPTISVKYSKKDTGVFALLYRYLTSWEFPLSTINVKTLLGYCSDISFQYSQCNYGEYKIIPGVFAHLLKEVNGTQVTWGLLGIIGAKSLESYPKTFTKISNYYERVLIDKMKAKEVFGIPPHLHSSVTYLQSRVVKPLINDRGIPVFELVSEATRGLAGYFQPNMFGGDYDFYVTLPYQKNKQAYMNEFLAIYLVMFYLSDLVRYAPDALEVGKDKQAKWLLDSFVKFTPDTFIRMFIPRILGTNYVIISK